MFQARGKKRQKGWFPASHVKQLGSNSGKSTPAIVPGTVNEALPLSLAFTSLFPGLTLCFCNPPFANLPYTIPSTCSQSVRLLPYMTTWQQTRTSSASPRIKSSTCWIKVTLTGGKEKSMVPQALSPPTMWKWPHLNLTLASSVSSWSSFFSYQCSQGWQYTHFTEYYMMNKLNRNH